MNKSAIVDLIQHAAVKGECKTGKKGYPTEEAARKNADRMNADKRRRVPGGRDGAMAQSYCCWYCGKWHNGRPRG